MATAAYNGATFRRDPRVPTRLWALDPNALQVIVFRSWMDTTLEGR
jgi:hypothetical protein